MIQIVWIIEPQPARLAEFHQAYGVNGDWVQLFRRAEGYLDTALLRDTENGIRFLVIDRWRDLSSFQSIQAKVSAAVR